MNGFEASYKVGFMDGEKKSAETIAKLRAEAEGLRERSDEATKIVESVTVENDGLRKAMWRFLDMVPFMDMGDVRTGIGIIEAALDGGKEKERENR